MADRPEGPEKLVRETAGRYRTADGRFTVEGEGGSTWYLADAEQTNELGLPILRGPFATLAQARTAIAEARASGAATEPRSTRAAAPKRERTATPKAERAAAKPKAERAAAKPRAATSAASSPAEPQTPPWLARLEPDARRDAERLVRELTELGLEDAARVVRRDLESEQPFVAETLLAGRLRADSIEPWTSSTAWIAAALDGRGPLREHATVIRGLLEAGVDRDELAELAGAIARRAVELALQVIDSGGFAPSLGRPPRGWRLLETDARSEPTDRRLKPEP